MEAWGARGPATSHVRPGSRNRVVSLMPKRCASWTQLCHKHPRGLSLPSRAILWGLLCAPRPWSDCSFLTWVQWPQRQGSEPLLCCCVCESWRWSAVVGCLRSNPALVFGHVTSPSLGFPICKVGIVTVWASVAHVECSECGLNIDSCHRPLDDKRLSLCPRTTSRHHMASTPVHGPARGLTSSPMEHLPVSTPSRLSQQRGGCGGSVATRFPPGLPPSSASPETIAASLGAPVSSSVRWG